MSRIRSIHPGIYSDESWASVSIAARWFAKGICTEADDNGVFEWKPLQLKMRIFPADAVDTAALLAELEGAGIVMRFEAAGKPYGALKNFCKYQRPRKPKAWFPLTEAVRKFAAIGYDAADTDDAEPLSVTQKSEPTPDEGPHVPPKSEKSSQMEDGGGRGVGEEGSEAKASSPAAPMSPKRAVWETDDLFSKAWDRCTPQMRKRSKSRAKTWPAWKASAKLAGGADRLLAALDAYLRSDPDVKRTGGPGFHGWLADGKWEAALAAAPTITSLHQWAGPAKIRADVVGERGEGFAKAYLDPAEWDGSAIVARTKYAVHQLRELYALKSVEVLAPREVAA